VNPDQQRSQDRILQVVFQVHGRIDRLERAEMIDPHSVQQDGDEMSGTGEIGVNAPNEANFAESTSIVETQDSIQVTPNSGARSPTWQAARRSEGRAARRVKLPELPRMAD
jgi:hypothetical protein